MGSCKSNQINTYQIILVFEERGKSEYPEKTSRSRVENQQTQPAYDAGSGNRTQATLVGGEVNFNRTMTMVARVSSRSNSNFLLF